ncbi:MAG: GIY-YIG nuclease family protein [Cyclobacteriaceae bacterium]
MKTMEQGVYFIYAPNQNKVKIGRSKSIGKRYKDLRAGFMDEGELLISISTNNEIQLEAYLHRKFKNLRTNGEWFLITKHLKDFILQADNNYTKVNTYPALESFSLSQTYYSTENYNIQQKVDRIQKRIIIPVIFVAAGLITTNYVTSRLDTSYPALKIIYYIHFLFPLYVPIILKYSLEYLTHKTINILYLSTILVLVFEITTIVFNLDQNYIRAIRSIILLSFFNYILFLNKLVFAKTIKNKD